MVSLKESAVNNWELGVRVSKVTKGYATHVSCQISTFTEEDKGVCVLRPDGGDYPRPRDTALPVYGATAPELDYCACVRPVQL